MNCLELVRNRTRSQFGEVQIYLNYLSSLEPENPLEEPSLELKIQRGLYYVHLYAALEKSVNDTVESSLILISSKSVKSIHYSTGFSAVAFSNKLRAFKDSGYSSFFNKAVEIFSETRSANVTPINETVFSNNLQNVWAKTIDEVYLAFGMGRFQISAREMATINELVEKRNAVAHGRESASTVGERHRVDVLRQKFTIISGVANKVIDDMEEYLEKRSYVKSIAKKHYL